MCIRDSSDAIQSELNDVEFGFKDLGRFKKAITSAAKVEEQKFVEILLNGIDEQTTIFPDNGHLFVKVEASKKGENVLLVTFAGIGGTFCAFYDKEQRCFVGGLPPRIRSDVNFRVAEESQFEISTAIRIKPGRPAQLSGLSEHCLLYTSSLNGFHLALPTRSTCRESISLSS